MSSLPHTHSLPSSPMHTPTPKLIAFSSRGLGSDLPEFREQRAQWPKGVPAANGHPYA